MISERDREHVEDMQRYAEEALRLLGDFDARSLAQDHRTLLAIYYALLVVGEAAARTSPDLRANLPDIEWGRIVGMRNRLAHGYDEISLDIVVDTVRSKLPELISRLRAALRDETP